MQAEDWDLLGDCLLDPRFSLPSIQMETEQQSPAMEPVANKHPNDDVYITEFLDSVLNNNTDFLWDCDMSNLAKESEIGHFPVSLWVERPTAKQVASS